MNSPPFPSTLPTPDPVPVRPVDLSRAAAQALGGAPDGASAFDSSLSDFSSHSGTDLSALSSFSPSLMQDLMRFERLSDQRELIEVLAACVRHTQAVAVRLAWDGHELTLTVFPQQRLVHCPMAMDQFLSTELAALRVLRVLPAALRPPGDLALARVGNPAFYAPLAPLLWAVALRGARSELLPELSGPAAFRVAPALHLGGLSLPAAMEDCINWLRQRSVNAREVADWHGIGRERASRLLNALYLQSGLIVSRTHPAATNEGWGGYR